MKPLSIRFLLAGFFVCFSVSSFAADIYLKVTDSKGSSQLVSCTNLDECVLRDLAAGEYTVQQLDAEGKPLTNLQPLQHEVKSPRDAASGLATGKRTHKPMALTTGFSVTESGSELKVSLDHNSSRSNKTATK